jgi:enoyl-CoA hydratase/carnithine racemase
LAGEFKEKFMSDRVRVDIENNVATVTLNRADKHNAVDMAMFEALTEAGDSLKDTPSVRAIVLHGAGRNFCAGIDVSVFGGEGIGAVGARLMDPRERSPANIFQSAAWVWREVPVPVIAALQGTVFGAGLQIALGADIRYAAPDVQMSIMEIKWGLIPDMAISSTARQLLRADKFRELAFTGRIVGGSEAQEVGLVTSLTDEPLETAHAAAREIAGRSPDAIRAIKRLLNDAWQADAPASLRREAELQLAVMSGTNQAEAVLANMEKRAPDFTDPEP